MRTFAPVFEKHLLNTTKDGPFVYRLGRKIFILERGVRFSHGLLPKTTSAKAEKKDGPFVYRLGRKIFILERGVRFSHGLPEKSYPRNRVTLFRFRIFSLPLLESIYKIRRGDTYMSTKSINAELFRQLSYIADDENCMKKALDYIRKLAIQKEKAQPLTATDTLAEDIVPYRTKEELKEGFNQACQEAKHYKDGKLQLQTWEEVYHEL